MSARLYSARVSTFRKEGTWCHLSLLTLEVCAENEEEARAIIAEEYDGEEITIDRIEEIHEDTHP